MKKTWNAPVLEELTIKATAGYGNSYGKTYGNGNGHSNGNGNGHTSHGNGNGYGHDKHGCDCGECDDFIDDLS